jgi:F0F1-type ATP synthase membrane subunit c/vacuolar-type H+-ATPase subunit K
MCREPLAAMTTAQKSLQQMRVLHLVFLGTGLAYLVLPLAYAPTLRQETPPVVPLTMGIVSLAVLGVAWFYRSRMVQPASEIVRNNPEDKVAIGQWRGGVLLTLVLCETVVLFGLTLKFLKVSWIVCGIFYAVGMFFMLAWWPRLELPPG